MQVQDSHSNHGNISEHPPSQRGPPLALPVSRKGIIFSHCTSQRMERNPGRAAPSPALLLRASAHRQLTKASFFSFQSICLPLSPHPPSARPAASALVPAICSALGRKSVMHLGIFIYYYVYSTPVLSESQKHS